MTPEEAAAASANAVSTLSAAFMLDAETYAYGGSLGFDGIDFYAAGRGGVLGDVDADVVAAAFVFFNPARVRASWEGSRAVMPRAKAAAEFAGCLHRWSQRLPDDLDAGRLASLAGRVVDSASPAGAPVFAGWRHLELPSDPKALACHHMNALRELRMAMHGAGVLAAGLRPVEALLVKTPYMAGIFGWEDDLPEVDHLHDTWAEAERATNRAMAHAFAVLDDDERSAFVELADAALVASTG